MKLHRFDEARKLALTATRSSELSTRISGYNGLLSIEFEREKPKLSYEVSVDAVRATAEQSCIINLNTAEAAFAVFKFAAVEAYANKSIQAPLKDCPASAHLHLANLYLLRGDFGRAISAVKDARTQEVNKRMRQQFEMTVTSWLTRLLYSMGQFDKVLKRTDQVLRAPDRLGFSSYSPELMQTIYRLDNYAAILAEIERLKEHISVRSFSDAMASWAKIRQLESRAWTARHAIRRLITENRFLPSIASTLP